MAAKKKTAAPSDPAAPVRAIVTAWPEVSEKISHGMPTWWGGRKTFANMAVNHHGDGRVAVWIKQPEGAQAALVEAAPDRFFVPPYVGPSGWVGVRLEGDVDWDEVRALLLAGYRTVAPKRALKLLDAEPPA